MSDLIYNQASFFKVKINNGGALTLVIDIYSIGLFFLIYATFLVLFAHPKNYFYKSFLLLDK